MTLRRYIGQAAIAAAVAVSFAFAPFGLNVQDEGFYFTFYQNIFSHPEEVAFNFSYYLTGPVGGLWLKMLPCGGLLWLRVLGIVVMAIAALIACRTLSPVMGRRMAFGASALLLLTPVFNTFTFGNTQATVLLYAVMTLCLTRGLTRRRTSYIVAAGLAAGMNCFVRIPNVLGLAAVVLILFSDGPRDFRRNIRPALYFLLGALLGIALVVGLQAALGHLHLFGATLRELFSGNDAPEMPHSASALVMAQVNHYVAVALRLLPLAAVIALLRLKRWHRSAAAPWIVATVAIGTAAVTRLPAVVWTIALLGALLALRDSDRQRRLVIAAALFMLLVIPCGSDNYFNCGTLTALLAFPLAVEVFYRRYPMPTLVALALLTGACLAVRAANAYHILVPEPAHTAVNSTQLRGIRCETYKAQSLNAMLDDTRDIIRPGDTLLVFANAPMVNAITETVPALGNSWPGLMNNDTFVAALNALPAGTPILVQNFIGTDWQHRPYEHLGEDNPDALNTSNRKLIALDHFFATHRYSPAPQRTTRYFTLYLPQRR